MIDLFDVIRDTVVELVGNAPNEITPESNLREDLNLDSLDGIELMLALENKLAISIDDDQMANIQTVQQLVDYLQKLLDEKVKPAEGAQNDNPGS